MRKIPVLFLAALAAVTCEPAAAERPQREFEPNSSAHSSGNPVRLAGTLPAHSSIVQSKPLHGAEIAERLGLGGGVLVSTWEAGFPKTVTWRPENVVDDGEGGVALRLSISPDPAPRPYLGAEFQAKGYAAVWGRVEWRGRLPAGIPGSVVGMFLYKTPFTAGTDRELDLEYVPGDPKVAHNSAPCR